MNRPPAATIRAIQAHFQAVIRGRAAVLVDKHKLKLPTLVIPVARSADDRSWFPIPGMCGGFSYWFEGDGEPITLLTESWCRVARGSGERHEITAAGSRLVDEGFA